MSTQIIDVQTPAGLGHPQNARPFRTIKLLAGGYAGVSVLTLAAIVLLRNHAAIVNPAVWTRGSIVVASSLLTFRFAAQAAHRDRRAYRRLRLISAVMVAVIAVIVALPGTFPVWMKAEQGLCAVLLAGIAVLVNGRQVRSLYAAK